MKQLEIEYQEYCESMKEDNKVPLSYEDWIFEKEQEEVDLDKTTKRCSN